MSDAPESTAVTEPSAREEWASALVERLDAQGFTVEFDTVHITVDPSAWVGTIVAAIEELPLFSWLSAIDWSKEVAIGEEVENPDELVERFDVLCRLSSVETDDGAIFVSSIPKDDPVIGSLTPHIGGAEWHERETHEMFGIMFEGNTNLTPLYLPDDFVGHPLLKSYRLLARDVKPWPGEVDVEDMPAADTAESGEGGESG